MDAIKVAVITVLHNRYSADCLISIEKSVARASIPTKFIIVDNAAVGFDVQDIVSKYAPSAVVVRSYENRGFGHGNNFGVNQIEAEHYFLLNPDTVLHEEEIIDKLYTYVSTKPEVGLVAPKLLYPDGRLQETCRRYPSWYMFLVQRTALKNTGFGQRYLHHFLMRDFNHEQEKAVDWVLGSAMFVRGEIWHKIRGFDDQFFMYFEDIDLCRRINQQGYKVMYVPGVSLIHAHERASAAESNILKAFLYNKLARHHFASYIKYFWKWFKARLSGNWQNDR